MTAKDADKGVHFVRCLMCESRFDLGSAADASLNKLPDQIVARCPHCRAQGLYGKPDIFTLIINPEEAWRFPTSFYSIDTGQIEAPPIPDLDQQSSQP